MGNGFELRIGMTTQQVMSNISRMNATDKTKQMIINFCNNDQDKKISNEIELAMLNSWASGSEKVKMPTPEGMTKIKSSNPVGYFTWGGPKDVRELYQAGKNRLLQIYSSIGNADVVASTHYQNNEGQMKIDSLFDKDRDGYADFRTTTYFSDNDNTKHDFEETLIDYKDNDLNGIYDTKDIQTTTDDATDNGAVITIKTETTDLHTGESTKNVEKHIW